MAQSLSEIKHGSERRLENGAARDAMRRADFENPVLTYSNTGNDDNGFLAWGNKDAAVSDNIPNHFFSSVDVIVQAMRTDGNLEERVVAANVPTAREETGAERGPRHPARRRASYRVRKVCPKVG